MKMIRAGTAPTRRTPADYFTGVVWQDPIVDAPAPARVRAARVTFAPGARTNWHTHPLGQTLYVISGVGRFQTQGEKIIEIRAGDALFIPPGERHWHGAAPDTMMVHVAIHEALDGTHVTWLEPVTEEQYAAEL
jgi:quercetin dioxygenase-like cupin family protein